MRARSLLEFATFLIASVPANRSVAQSRPTAESSPTLELRGRVLDTEGAPIKEAGIAVGPANRTATVDALTKPSVKTDADGRFSVQISNKPASAQIVLIAAPGRISAAQTMRTLRWHMLIGRSADQVVDLGDLRLPHGLTVKGRVRKIDGSPIPGALVRAEDMLRSRFSPPGSPRLMCQAVTDTTGGFTLPAVFPLANSITVEADGWYSQTVPSVKAGDPLLVTLVESGFVEGIVQDEKGTPLDGHVTMIHEFPVEWTREFPTEWIREPLVGGSFRLPVRVRGRFRIFGRSRDGQRACIAASDYLDGPAKGLILRPRRSVKEGYAVRAIDATTRQPITEFRAGAWWHGGTFKDQMENWLDRTVEEAWNDGLVILPEPNAEETRSGSGVLRVRATGYAPLTAEQVEWKKGEVFEALLTPESRLDGRVLDEASGQPIAGAFVSWARAGQKQSYPMSSPSSSLVTGPEGAFAIGELGPGSYEITVHRPQSSVVDSTTEEVKAGAKRTGIELKVPAGVALAGKIVGAKGAGWRLVLARARKRGEWESEEEEMPWIVGTRVTAIGPDGSFRFEGLGQGDKTLSLEIPAPPGTGADLRIRLDTVHVRKQDLRRDLDLSADLPGTVAGRLSWQGRPAPQGRFVVLAIRKDPEDEEWLGSREMVRRRRWTLSAEDGTFELILVPGEHRIQVIDCATGVVLHEHKETVRVASQQTSRVELAFQFVEMHVTLEAEQGRRVITDRVAIRGALDPGNSRPRDIQVFRDYGLPSIDSPDGETVPVFFVPPGMVRLWVPYGVKQISANSVSLGGVDGDREHRGVKELKAQVGKRQEVTLTVGPPRELRERTEDK